MKAKLPFLKKKDEGDELEENSEADESSRSEDVTGATDLSSVEDIEEDEEAVASNASLIHKLKAKIQSLSTKPSKAKKESVEATEGPADDDEAAKKKKRSRIIQAVIGLGLVVFLAEDYIIPKEEPMDNTPVPPPKARPRPEPKPAETTPPATVETPATPTEATTPPTETAATPTEVTPAPTEVAPTETTPAETTPSETVATEPSTTTETLPDSPVDVTSTEIPSGPIEATPEDTAPAIEEPSTTPDTTITETPSETTPSVSMDTIDGEVTPSEDNLTDQILQDLEKQAKDTEPKKTIKEYVAPPDYEYRGRGLVYNCAGKHWACIDAPSYKICEDNAASTQFLKKTVECHPVNIYETQKGCESTQNRMVSSSAKTAFCN
ncbi:hypothetical protein ACJVC5_08110 [Peredibacter sp. HCB2-198]|uniref:hypothetical protein n=1 Tax=Peredibacter sp. HCB2-198 TaxID=3383025 RepID=UPI0038B5A858